MMKGATTTASTPAFCPFFTSQKALCRRRSSRERTKFARIASLVSCKTDPVLLGLISAVKGTWLRYYPSGYFTAAHGVYFFQTSVQYLGELRLERPCYSTPMYTGDNIFSRDDVSCQQLHNSVQRIARSKRTESENICLCLGPYIS